MIKDTPDIEINDQFRYALDIMEKSRRSIFITGRAGTGKSTLLNYFRNSTGKRIAVLAPTGVAAINVNGQTIHSFFRFKPGITPEHVRKRRSSNKSIYHKIDMIVVDEISMVRADLLDCMDKFLRLNGPSPEEPFGGIQMAFIGDLYQLPPVVTGNERKIIQMLYETPYFYSANVFRELDMDFVELEKIYRQRDNEFIGLLNSIRNNSITRESLDVLNKRYLPEFTPPPDDFYVYLTTTNKLAEEINTVRLKELKGRSYKFTGTVIGDFGQEYLATKIKLELKSGAQVMMLNNDFEGRWINGTIGKVSEVVRNINDDDVIVVELADGEEVEIAPFTWEVYRFYVENGGLQSEVIGTFTQYPLMLAWAVTIHKGQGKTFDNVIIDIGNGIFAQGQMYVALSRCTTLDGIVLRKPVLKKHIWTNYRVMDFLTKYQYGKAEVACSTDTKMEIIAAVIKNKGLIEIVYLKPNDEKSTRIVRPESIGEMEYRGKTYLGMRAFCMERQDYRTFRIDRILKIKEVR